MSHDSRACGTAKSERSGRVTFLRQRLRWIGAPPPVPPWGSATTITSVSPIPHHGCRSQASKMRSTPSLFQCPVVYPSTWTVTRSPSRIARSSPACAAIVHRSHCSNARLASKRTHQNAFIEDRRDAGVGRTDMRRANVRRHHAVPRGRTRRVSWSRSSYLRAGDIATDGRCRAREPRASCCHRRCSAPAEHNVAPSR